MCYELVNNYDRYFHAIKLVENQENVLLININDYILTYFEY